MRRMDGSQRKLFSTAIAFFLVVSLLLGACQALGQPGPTLTAPPKPTATRIPSTVTPTHSPTPPPTPTATSVPLNFWVDPVLPADVINALMLPGEARFVEDVGESNFHITPAEGDLEPLAETSWTYVLAAPFFTIWDEVSVEDLAATLTSAADDDTGLPSEALLIRSSDYQAVLTALELSPPRGTTGSAVELAADDVFSQPTSPSGTTWAILPFEQLNQFWKVIRVEGASPLDDDFDPENYALSLQIVIEASADIDTNDLTTDFTSILPPPNRDENKLTSLIMTGVTAMTRDTAYIMSTEGVLFPGTEIRDFMRAADLTHISNEVSFYEDCPFPNPDYTGFLFCSDPEYIELLDDLGADIIELTGNHNNDVRALYKVDSVPTTLELYEEYNMQWYAGGVNISDAKAPLLVEHNGNKLAFIGCNSYGPEMAWAAEDQSGAAPCEDFAWIIGEVSRLKGEGYLPIVTFQFQEDYWIEPTSRQLRDFRPLADAGAVIVNGSQSHVAKAMEFYNGAFIHYGLGNLFFDQPEFYITYDGFIQKHHFYEGKLINTELITITIIETGKPGLMSEDERWKFLGDIFAASEGLRREQ